MSSGENIRFLPGVEDGANKSGEINIDGDCLVHIPVPPPDSSVSEGNVSRKDILDYGDQCFLLNSVLSHKECEHFILEGEKAGFHDVGYSREDYRSSKRISFQSLELAALLWERIKNQIEDVLISGDPQDLHIEGPSLLLQGKWEAIGLNSVWRLCKYFPGGHFAPHNDGFFAVSAAERSLKTFMLYLNGDFIGGSTNFVDPSQALYKGSDGKYCAEDKNILYRVQPEEGMAIVFNHNRLHEGQRLENGVKYILRTDIMYRNTNPKPVSGDQDKAMKLMQEADRLEAAGECMEAMELYRKAFKLSPELAHSYGF